MPEIVSDYQHPRDVITVDRNSEINYANVVDCQTDSTADRLTDTTAAGVASKSDGTIDPMYTKVKKPKKSWNPLYSKPIKKKKKQQFDAADHKSGMQDGASLYDLYTKSKKHRPKRSKGKSEIDAMYTKPKKKRKHKKKNADYANDLQLQTIRDGININDAVAEDNTSKHAQGPVEWRITYAVSDNAPLYSSDSSLAYI